MPQYHPQTPWENALQSLAQFPGKAGRNARRWLRKRYIARAMADFDRRVARLGPGSVCLDLGANVGSITARLAQSGALVHAYEPDPLAFAELQRRVGHLPNVVLHQAAVAARGGRARLRRAAQFDGNPLGLSIMSSIQRQDPAIYAGGQEIEVEVRAFRDVLAGIGGPVALVKMDIEGSEFDILRDLFADPATHDIDAVFCETHEYDLVAEKAEVARMIAASDRLARPHVNLYWP